MSHQTIQKMLHNLSQEVIVLRSLFISIVGTDAEGAYKPAFVKSILKNIKNNKPTEKFTTAKNFLEQLKKA